MCRGLDHHNRIYQKSDLSLNLSGLFNFGIIMDYEEEQSGELEALESIYSEELEVLSAEPPRSFTFPVKTADYDEDDPANPGMYVLLKFIHTPKYPEELPEIEIEDFSDNFESDLQSELLSHLKEICQENLGMVMIFTAVSEAIEWLGSKHEKLESDKAEAARLKKERDEEEERKKLEGTKVTIESFLKWKAEFDAERLAAKRSADLKNVNKDNKLNGKELFMTNHTLQDSDIKFLEAAGESVTVDESLFEDLDDLDLDDDDDDPDFDPDNLSD